MADNKAGAKGDGGEAAGARYLEAGVGLRLPRQNASANSSAADNAVTKPTVPSATRGPSRMSTQT